MHAVVVALMLCVLLVMQLQDVDDVYETVGDAMLGFIGHRLAKRVFPNAMLSKEDFWSYLPWMRAMVFVFLSRYVHKKQGQGKWSRFPLAEYKFNKRTFAKYMANDRAIIEASSMYHDLPDKPRDPSQRKGGRGQHKSKRRRNSLSAAGEYSTTESPVTKRVNISLDFTDSDDAGSETDSDEM